LHICDSIADGAEHLEYKGKDLFAESGRMLAEAEQYPCGE